jgi:hypothetical protein
MAVPNLNRILFGIGAVLGTAALIGVLIFLHTRAVSTYGDQRYHDGVTAQAAVDANKTRALETENTRLALELRAKTDAKVSAITSHASALQLRGPGKATCTSVSGSPAPASGHDEGNGAGTPALGGVPDTAGTGLIAMPFSATLAAFAQCDANRAEVEAWRTQRQQQYDTYMKEAK